LLARKKKKLKGCEFDEGIRYMHIAYNEALEDIKEAVNANNNRAK